MQLVEEKTTSESIASIAEKIDPFAVVGSTVRTLKNGQTKKTIIYYAFCPTCSLKGFKVNRKLRKGSVVVCPICSNKVKLKERPYGIHATNTMLRRKSGLPLWKYENIKNSKEKLSLFSAEWTISLKLDPLLRFSYISICTRGYSFSFNKESRILYFIEQDHERKSKIKNVTYGGNIRDTLLTDIIGQSQSEKNSTKNEKFPSLTNQYFNILGNYCIKPPWSAPSTYDIFELYAAEKYPGLLYLMNKTPITRSLRLASKRSKRILQESRSAKEILEKVSGVKVSKKELSLIGQLEKPVIEFYLFYRTFIPDATKRIRLLEKLQGKRWYNTIIQDEYGTEYGEIDDNDPDLYPVPIFLNAKRQANNGVYDFVKEMNQYRCKDDTEKYLYTAFLNELDNYDESATLNSCYSLITTIRDVSEALESLRIRYQPLDSSVKRKCIQLIRSTKHMQQLESKLNVYIRQLKLQYPDNTMIPINYNENEQEKFNRQIGDYEFTLAESNTEMEVVGDELSICVGNHDYYFYWAIRKKLYIIFIRDAFGRAVCTLEINNRNKLIQAKGKYNNENFPLDESVSSAVKHYCSENKINWRNTSDLT